MILKSRLLSSVGSCRGCDDCGCVIFIIILFLMGISPFMSNLINYCNTTQCFFNLPEMNSFSLSSSPSLPHTSPSSTLLSIPISTQNSSLNSTQQSPTQHIRKSLSNTDHPQPPTHLSPDYPYFFLHSRKTGSSFANMILHWGCPSVSHEQFRLIANDLYTNRDLRPKKTLNLPKDCLFKFRSLHAPSNNKLRPEWFIGDHIPLNATLQNESLSNVFMSFRDPKERIRSYVEWVYEYAPWDCNDNIPQMNPSQLNEMTYFILGRVPESIEDVEKACERVWQFGWIGTVNQYKESVCIFHKKFGGQTTVNEMEPLIPTQTNSLCRKKAREWTYDSATPWFDMILYDMCLKKRFEMDLNETNCRTDEEK
jgi:hypothetical protein